MMSTVSRNPPVAGNLTIHYSAKPLGSPMLWDLMDLLAEILISPGPQVVVFVICVLIFFLLVLFSSMMETI